MLDLYVQQVVDIHRRQLTNGVS